MDFLMVCINNRQPALKVLIYYACSRAIFLTNVGKGLFLW